MYELIGNAPINDDGTLLLSVYNDRNTIIVSLIEENNDSISHGVGSLSKEEFLRMTPKSLTDLWDRYMASTWLRQKKSEV